MHIASSCSALDSPGIDHSEFGMAIQDHISDGKHFLGTLDMQ
jgi:hypothetical protein